jgi:hypothetical protein
MPHCRSLARCIARVRALGRGKGLVWTAAALTAFAEAAAAWRATLLTADDAALSAVGWSTYPNGSDPEDAFIDTVWWVNQEVLHHGAEIALLRDLYRPSRLPFHR